MSLIRSRNFFLLLFLLLLSTFVLLKQGTIQRNRINLQELGPQMQAVKAAQQALEQKNFNEVPFIRLKAELGSDRSSHWLLNQADLFWKTGEKDTVEFILLLIDHDHLSLHFALPEKQEAANLWRDLANSKPNLTPPQQINYLNQSLALDPNNPDALALKGLAFEALGQRQAGESLIQLALSIASDHTGKSLIILGEHIRRDNADPALVGEAWIWMRAGRFYSYYDLDKAEKMTHKSLDLYANEWAQDLMAEILFRQDHCIDALPFAQAATKLLPEYLPFQKRLGDIYWCLGDKIQAKQIYQQIIVQDSSYEIILHDRLSGP